ncbi:acyltransferase family protein [Tetragenococcus halophilus]|uniref:acyltransferase family protein n=1 Tax=Tetragenococcus halophilus TaxID=51669 RepID=UPI00077CC553|nr:acyltransferase [Tetragenococcus halophilus]
MKNRAYSTRDIRIDILRSLAILLIILAHVKPPTIIFQTRVFDVPLMTLLLGMSFVLSSKKHRQPSFKFYIIKRFERLVVPAWIFLTIFFAVTFIAGGIFNVSIPYNLKTIITSYTLISGIGYVWIIRVFFIIAIFSPLLLKLSINVNKISSRVLLITLLLFIQEFFGVMNSKLLGVPQRLFEHFVAVSFGYLIIALIGMWVIKQTTRENLIVGIYSLIGFMAIAIYTGSPLIGDQKYPPRAYFLLYGISISIFLFVLVSNKFCIQSFERIKFVIWLSKHSLELYYWHIFPVLVIQFLVPDFNWILKYLLVLGSALIITKLQTTYLPKLFQFDYLTKRIRNN